MSVVDKTSIGTGAEMTVRSSLRVLTGRGEIAIRDLGALRRVVSLRAGRRGRRA